MVTLERDIRRTRWQIPLRITQAVTEMGGGGFGWKSEGVEIARQRRALQKDLRANEVRSKGRICGLRAKKGEHHAGMKRLCGIQSKKGV
jgi:hypothetical protein